MSAAVIHKKLFRNSFVGCYGKSGQWLCCDSRPPNFAEGAVPGSGALETDLEFSTEAFVNEDCNPTSGEQRGAFGGSRWFFIDGLMNIVAPNICLQLLPQVKPGMHRMAPSKERPRKNRSSKRGQAEPKKGVELPGFPSNGGGQITRLGTEGLLQISAMSKRRKNTRDGAGNCSEKVQAKQSLPETALCYRVYFAFKFQQEKRNDFLKSLDIMLDSLFIERSFVSLRAKPVTTACCLRALHNSDVQVGSLGGSCVDAHFTPRLLCIPPVEQDGVFSSGGGLA